MKLKHYAADGAGGEERDFAVPEFKGDKGVEALRQVLVASMTNFRRGNASTRTRAEVRGGGRKPHRQKGTGSARAGSRRSPIWRGGGVVFGPKPRDYTQKINRKVKWLAFRRAIFDRGLSGDICIIERFDGAQSKTREMESLIRRIVPDGGVLLVDDSFADGTVLAARNIGRVTLGEADTVNAFDFSRWDTILISEKGFDRVLARVSGEAKS